MHKIKVIISYIQNNQSSLNPLFDSIPSDNSFPSGMERALSWDLSEGDSVLQTRQSCGALQTSRASCVVLRSNAGAPFAVAGTISLASACSHGQNNGKAPHFPAPGFEEGPLRTLRLSTLTAEYVRHLHMGTTLSDSADRKEAFFIPFPAHWLWCFRILDLGEKSQRRLCKGDGVPACGFYPVNLGVLSSPGESKQELSPIPFPQGSFSSHTVRPPQ